MGTFGLISAAVFTGPIGIGFTGREFQRWHNRNSSVLSVGGTMNFMIEIYVALAIISIVMIFIGASALIKALYGALLIVSVIAIIYHWKRKKPTET